jgi:hyaluronate lyase
MFKSVNQQLNSGQWNTLGVYSFNGGTSGSVVIGNTGTNGFVVADAVKFVRRTLP